MTIAQQIERMGMQKGIIEGEKQGSMKIARQLLEKGVEREIIKMSTLISDTDMKKLFKDLKHVAEADIKPKSH